MPKAVAEETAVAPSAVVPLSPAKPARPDLSRLVSLGVMTSDSGTFPVPAGLNLSEYPIVDVSDEPVDGNPAHSSVSIVRGTLVS